MSDILNPLLAQIAARGLVVNYIRVYRGDTLQAAYDRLNVPTRLNTWSVCKSFVSVGAGIAMEEGLISLDERIADAFPEYIGADANESLRATTVRHMLTMTSGLTDALFFGDDPQRYVTRDWLRCFFEARFDYAPGERFLYSNFHTYVLSCLIEKRSGLFLADYLRERLFEKLDIFSPDWTRCPMGHCHAANGLYLTIDELARFGLMLLHGGEYKGRRVVSEDYLRQACVNQMPEHIREPSFGYQFWIAPDGRSYSANGKYGQFVIVVPEKDAVVAVQSLDDGMAIELVREALIERL